MALAQLRALRFGVLIALDAIAELRAFQVEADRVRIGAALPLSSLEQHLSARDAFDAPALRAVLPLFASRLIRNRATLGGNLATASPIGDAAPVLLALGATVTLEGPSGQRELSLHEFFTGYRT